MRSDTFFVAVAGKEVGAQALDCYQDNILFYRILISCHNLQAVFVLPAHLAAQSQSLILRQVSLTVLVHSSCQRWLSSMPSILLMFLRS